MSREAIFVGVQGIAEQACRSSASRLQRQQIGRRQQHPSPDCPASSLCGVTSCLPGCHCWRTATGETRRCQPAVYSQIGHMCLASPGSLHYAQLLQDPCRSDFIRNAVATGSDGSSQWAARHGRGGAVSLGHGFRCGRQCSIRQAEAAHVQHARCAGGCDQAPTGSHAGVAISTASRKAVSRNGMCSRLSIMHESTNLFAGHLGCHPECQCCFGRRAWAAMRLPHQQRQALLDHCSAVGQRVVRLGHCQQVGCRLPTLAIWLQRVSSCTDCCQVAECLCRALSSLQRIRHLLQALRQRCSAHQGPRRCGRCWG